MTEYLNCPRKAYLGKERRISLRKTPLPFMTGRAVHAGIENIMKGMSIEGVIEETFDELPILDKEQAHKVEIEKAKCRGMLTGYLHKYGSEIGGYRRVLPEQEIIVPLIPGKAMFYSRLDALIQTGDLSWIIRETKTAARPDEDYFTRVKLDFQVLSQLWAAREHLGTLPKIVEYDVIKKPSIRLRVRESYAEFAKRIEQEYITHAEEKNLFDRREIIVDQSRVEDWYKQAKYLARLIYRSKSKNTEAAFIQNAGNCLNKFGSCMFLPICDTGRVNPLIYDEKGKR